VYESKGFKARDKKEMGGSPFKNTHEARRWLIWFVFGFPLRWTHRCEIFINKKNQPSSNRGLKTGITGASFRVNGNADKQGRESC